MKIIDFLNILDFQFKLEGIIDYSFELSKGTSFSNADAESFTFMGDEYLSEVKGKIKTDARVVFCSKALRNILGEKLYIVVDNPRLAFIKAMNKVLEKPLVHLIHPTVVSSSSSIIGYPVFIGANVFLGENSQIGNNCIVYPNVTIYDNVKIGNNVVIHSGTVIGADGFGYERQLDGTLIKFPHVGGVIIEDNVEIGANSCIDKGTLDNTVICNGTKIDNLVHIAHNCLIGQNSCVIANAMIGGSTKIGENTWISPSASLLDRIEIGSGTIIGMGSVIGKNIGPNEIWTGNPGKPLDELKKLNEKLKNL